MHRHCEVDISTAGCTDSTPWLEVQHTKSITDSCTATRIGDRLVLRCAPRTTKPSAMHNGTLLLRHLPFRGLIYRPLPVLKTVELPNPHFGATKCRHLMARKCRNAITAFWCHKMPWCLSAALRIPQLLIVYHSLHIIVRFSQRTFNTYMLEHMHATDTYLHLCNAYACEQTHANTTTLMYISDAPMLSSRYLCTLLHGRNV